MIHTSHPTWKRYLVAVLTVAGGLLIRLPLVSLLGTTVPYITFFPAIAVSAGYGGFIGGLIATILSAVAAFYFVIHFGSLADLIRGPEAIGSVIFLFVGTMLSWLFESLQRRRRALQEQEERHRLILNSALDAVITIDQNGIVTGWNAQAEQAFGWTLGEILGQSLRETIIPSQHRESHDSGMKHFLRTGEGPVLGKRIEITALHRNGHEFPVELAITPIRQSDRVSFSAFIRDISERKRLEGARILLARIIETSDDAIISKTLDGIVTSWNVGAEKIFGYSAGEMIGQPVSLLIPPEARDEEPDILTRIQRGETIDHYEAIRMRKDGTPIYVSLTVSPLKEADGTIIGASKIARDISERKRANEKLQAQVERLNLLDQITRAVAERQDLRSIFQVVIRSLEDSLPISFGCVCIYDRIAESLTVTCVGARSEGLATQLAMTEEAKISIDQNGLARCVRGQLVYEPDLRQVDFPFPRRLLDGGLGSVVMAPLVFESRVFGILVAARCQPDAFSSGDCEFLRQLSVHVALAAHQAELNATLQHAYDDLRQTQQAVIQQERLGALGQMASGIAHDINNALSPMALSTEWLLEREANLSTPIRQYLETTRRSLDDIAHTVARMQEFYRQREPQLTLLPVDLNSMVDQVLDLTRARWSDMPQKRGVVIEIRTELAEDRPIVSGIESEIREALVNLIFNSVDAMPGGGTLTVRTRASNGAGSPSALLPHVDVEITDTGQGMDEETRRRCLEPFFTTKGERGTGLGLAMVFGVMQRHNAEIEIDSAPGEGTTVRLSFPARATRAAETAPASAQAIPPQLRILVIDDDPLILKSLRETLEADGHVVITANSGEEGIKTFQASQDNAQFNVVITDLGMPRVDGRKVAEAVKKSHPSIPVILLTGWGQRLIAEGDVPPQVDRVLSKPPKLRELRAVLAELVAETR